MNGASNFVSFVTNLCILCASQHNYYVQKIFSKHHLDQSNAKVGATTCYCNIFSIFNSSSLGSKCKYKSRCYCNICSQKYLQTQYYLLTYQHQKKVSQSNFACSSKMRFQSFISIVLELKKEVFFFFLCQVKREVARFFFSHKVQYFLYILSEFQAHYLGGHTHIFCKVDIFARNPFTVLAVSELPSKVRAGLPRIWLNLK